MANCPTLQDFLATDMCEENLAGTGTVIYFGLKSDLSSALTANENVYSTPAFTGGLGLYKMDCKDEGQQIQGSSLGQNKGFKIQLDFTVEMVNKVTSIIGRALNNFQDLFFIVKDGDNSQILYDPSRKCKFESDGLKTDTGKAAADDRVFTGSVVLSPVKYPNLFVTEPSGGWDTLRASGSAHAAVATPVITLSGSSATITCATEGADIYYTKDGSNPASAGATKYSSAVSLSSGDTIKAVAIKSGNTSAVASKTYSA